ncbi:MAG: SPASM domain-containing protein [Anaerolineae bacterium]|nr:SPASM domain-containing protein [Anaerolineae bacterium]
MSGLQQESDCACADFHIADNDCACADDNGAHIPHALDNTIAWQRAPALYRAPLVGDYELALNSFATGLVVLNAPARRVLDAFAQPRTLPQALAALDWFAHAYATRAAREFAALGLLRPVGVSNIPTHTQPRTLTAWLHITNACNLRCAYCYVDKTNEAMDERTGIAAVDAIFHSAQAHGFRAVKLKYAGGEPSLNFALVMKLHAHARHLADSSGLELREVILSNGVALTDAMLDAIRDARIRLMLSLDGIGATNDAQRASADGRGSYARIVHTIDRALARGITPHLSITVTARNANHLAETVAFALERELPFNLNFVRGSGVSNATLIRGVRAALAVIENNLPKHSLLGVLDLARLDQPHAYTCGVGHSYVVIDHRGRIARCHTNLARTVGDVRHDDPLLAIQSARGDFENVSVEQKDGCRECTWRYWCAGGCPLLSLKTTGQSNAPSPYCEAYKALYPELVRLEGLRLLRWQHN